VGVVILMFVKVFVMSYLFVYFVVLRSTEYRLNRSIKNINY